ncbi:hypothetical protein O8B93_25080 [Agrobacterium rhizogenes]|uniref:hypothetical protein n=1 Tax=Rhizobium rhizogenes TaxID=359 RepID=UPI0022B60548|nr:hypothetical protein [Rhizobium rhizogenes]MCZ7450856.1 hypothetical protein [Rhizobium rhizogenes]
MSTRLGGRLSAHRDLDKLARAFTKIDDETLASSENSLLDSGCEGRRKDVNLCAERQATARAVQDMEDTDHSRP